MSNMIDFQNSSFAKLRKTNDEAVNSNIKKLLIDDETIIGTYKAVRDFIVFTDRRIITVNVQGVTGRKQDLTSLPYKRIQAFSVETSGVFDMDSELEVYFSSIGKLTFEFTGQSDIVEIGRQISEYIL